MMNLPLFLLQILVILVVARAVGLLFRKFHQPQVIGEMVAGILLGPSLFGWAFPELFQKLFSENSLTPLNAVSQIGLILFMFLIGLELDPKSLRRQGKAALIVSHASVIFPFMLGSLLALILYPLLSDQSVSFTHFSMFLGAAMSITAFPILARILSERNLLQTPMGLISIASAAINDVTGWILLAIVVLMVRSSGINMVLGSTFLGLAGYLIIMFAIIQPLFRKMNEQFLQKKVIKHDHLALIFLMVVASSLITEFLGVHALFGAFLAGLILPKEPEFVFSLTEKINDLVVVFLLPLFFSLTGLKTSINLIDQPILWLFTGLIIVVAVLGKFGGAAAAARLSGMTWRESGAVGALMNTRGLMELVLLNVGFEIGVISPILFAMLVIMAIVTTLLTAPLLEWIYYERIIPQKYPENEVIAKSSNTYEEVAASILLE
jgi:Kef-type K+ transport system membrane component KefB